MSLSYKLIKCRLSACVSGR